MWVIKIDKKGDLIWERSFGGKGYDGGRAIIENSYGNIMILGQSLSFDGDVSDPLGSSDFLLVNMTREGEILNVENLGTSNFDSGKSILELIDGSVFLLGHTTDNLSLDEKSASYFSGAEIGDITGEGIPEIIFFISNPTTGTQIYSYTINPGFIFTKLHEPYKIRSDQKQPTLLKASLATIYEDKDKEIVLSFGAPERKVMIINYSGELKSKTIAIKMMCVRLGKICLRITRVWLTPNA